MISHWFDLTCICGLFASHDTAITHSYQNSRRRIPSSPLPGSRSQAGQQRGRGPGGRRSFHRQPQPKQLTWSDLAGDHKGNTFAQSGDKNRFPQSGRNKPESVYRGGFAYLCSRLPAGNKPRAPVDGPELTRSTFSLSVCPN